MIQFKILVAKKLASEIENDGSPVEALMLFWQDVKQSAKLQENQRKPVEGSPVTVPRPKEFIVQNPKSLFLYH